MNKFLGSIYDDPIKFTIFSTILLFLTSRFLDIKGLLLLGVILLLIKIDSYGHYHDRASQKQHESDRFNILINRSKIIALMKKLKVNEKDSQEIFERIWAEHKKVEAFNKGVKPEDFESWKNKQEWNSYLNGMDRLGYIKEVEKMAEDKKKSQHEK